MDQQAAAVDGYCDARFDGVRAVLAERLASAELGAAVAVVVDGERAVDLRGGWADRRCTRPWRGDTLVNVYSATKGPTALCVLQAIERGALAPETRLVELWPEFAGDGRETVTVRHCLEHSAGMIGFRPGSPVTPEDLLDPPRAAACLAAEAPWWRPGSRHGYHARTFGILLGEAMRRATGRTLGAWLAEEVAAPLAADLHLGLPPSEHPRCAEVVPGRARAQPPAGAEAMLEAMADPDSATTAAFSRPPLRPGFVNTPGFRQAELPAMNGHATAAALAALYGDLARPQPRLLSAAMLAEAVRVHRQGDDAVLCRPTCFGLGFMLSRPALPLGPARTAFGHPGAGGSLAFADPDARLGFAFVMNRLQPGVVAGGETARQLVEAVYAAL